MRFMHDVLMFRGITVKAPNMRFFKAQGASLLAVIIIGSLLVACGQSLPGATHGTLTGDVVAGPTCPVERVGQSCPPKPVPNREIQILDARGAVVSTTKTDTNGHFSITLAPGAYVVHVMIVQGQIGMSQVSPGNVTVTSDETVYIKIELDTGIR